MNGAVRARKDALKRLDYVPDDLDFTKTFKRFCERNGRSRHDAIAAEAHLDAAYVYRLQMGEKRHPSANVVIRLAIALKLTVSETDELLMSAGYAPLVFPQDMAKSESESP